MKQCDYIFRAWHKKEKRMFDVKGISWYDGDVHEEYADCWRIGDGEGWSPEIIHEFEDCIFMQFTGKLDKDKKRIYDGDILEDKFNRKKIVGKVFWNKEALAWYIQPLGYPEYPLCLTKNPKVLGNIYENPELLNQK